MSDKLKPVKCGCGGEGLLDCWLGGLDEINLYYVHCDKCNIRTEYYPTEAEAIEAWNTAMGASAEPEQKWIPVSEALPEDMDRLLVTIVRSDGEKRVRSGDYYKGYFMMDNGDTWNETDKEVLAWMPLPEPWRGDR